MKSDLPVKNGIVIPAHELEITTSRSSGPGGQYVNKTDSRITVRWNVNQTHALSEEQKARVLQNLQAQLTTQGDLMVSNSASRSQQQNKEDALENLAQQIRKALYVPKKRMATRISKTKKEAYVQDKRRHGGVKKLRNKKYTED